MQAVAAAMAGAFRAPLHGCLGDLVCGPMPEDPKSPK